MDTWRLPFEWGKNFKVHVSMATNKEPWQLNLKVNFTIRNIWQEGPEKGQTAPWPIGFNGNHPIATCDNQIGYSI